MKVDTSGMNMQILIVEHDQVQANMASSALVSLCQTTQVADNGESALKLLKSRLFDVVLLNAKLPGISGLDILRWIRTHLACDCGVLFLSNRRVEVDIISAFEAGADDYIVKP